LVGHVFWRRTGVEVGADVRFGLWSLVDALLWDFGLAFGFGAGFAVSLGLAVEAARRSEHAPLVLG
jgi:hypothetical protein